MPGTSKCLASYFKIDMAKNNGDRKSNLGLGIAIGIAIGLALGVANGHLLMYVVFGAAFGAGFGLLMKK